MPVTTSALFFIPRTVPVFWRGLSRHLIELDSFPFLSLFCTYLLTSVLSPPEIGWRSLPCPPGHTVIVNKRHSCAGCHQSLSRNPEKLRCAFMDVGSATLGGIPIRPCKTAYHPTCIAFGSPFTSRHRYQAGLAFPAIHDWANFICKACTVRGILQRNLTGPDDWQLLALERMRLIDMAHYWAVNTHKTYGTKLQILRNFGTTYGFTVLQSTPLLRPLDGPEIFIIWCQEAYGLRPGHSRRKDNSDDLTLAFLTIRSIRSAASQFFAWDMMVSKPHEAYLDDRKRIIQQGCRPTDSRGPTFHASVMSAQIGDEAHPPMPLLDKHVHHLDQDLNQRYLGAQIPTDRRHFATAGLANLSLWLAWLCSSKVFGLEWCDLGVTEPHNGPQEDLPLGCGVFLFRLSPEIKSSHTKRADVVAAYETLSGLHLDKWFHRSRVAAGIGTTWSNTRLASFLHDDGTPWTSLYFRQQFLYPSLHAQQAAGDAYLRPHSGGLGNTLEANFWSLHCYQCRARSHVSRGGIYGQHCFRKPTLDQVYEHACWRRRRSREAIDVLYREWGVRHLIRLTLYG
jgi:hypothetical protein